MNFNVKKLKDGIKRVIVWGKRTTENTERHRGSVFLSVLCG